MSANTSPIRCVECDSRARFHWDTTAFMGLPMIVLMREHGINVYSFVCENCNTKNKEKA